MKRDIIVIGASAGGVEALPNLLSSLSASIPASFFITLHIAPDSQSYLPKLIARKAALPTEHARNGRVIKPRTVYVAPPDYHLILRKDVIELSHGPKENRHRPAIDPMFRSAAEEYGPRVAAVLLTGNLDDGVAGLQDVKRCGGLTMVQDPGEAAFPEMPRNALQALRPDYCLKLREIEQLIARLPEGSVRGGQMTTGNHRKEKARTSETQESQKAKKPPIPLVCPECQGPIWEFRDGKLLQYACLVGHRYTLDSLLAAQSEEIETSLWVALRALEERIRLEDRLAREAGAGGRSQSHKMFRARVAENEKHARILRQVIEKMTR